MGDYVGKFPLPKTDSTGLWGMLVWMKNPSGHIYEHSYAVTTGKPISIPVGEIVYGGFGTNEDTSKVEGTSPGLMLETMFAVDRDSHAENKKPVTLDTLLQWTGWPPYVMKVYPGSIHMTGGVASVFFDPDTGLEIIGSESGGLKEGYLFFGTGTTNPWP